MAQLNFNAANVAPQEPINPIPAGVYLAHAIESEVRPLKSGNGEALAITFQVLQGQYANRRVWANINHRHANQEAERIGQSQLSALCHAVGVINLQDTTQLHMRPVMIRVRISKDDSGQYPDKNEVTGYEAPAAGGAPAMPGAFPAQQQPAPQRQAFPPPAQPAMAQPAPATAAAAAGGGMPWARRA